MFSQLAPNVAEDPHLPEVDRQHTLGDYLTANSTWRVCCDARGWPYDQIGYVLNDGGLMSRVALQSPWPQQRWNPLPLNVSRVPEVVVFRCPRPGDVWVFRAVGTLNVQQERSWGPIESRCNAMTRPHLSSENIASPLNFAS